MFKVTNGHGCRRVVLVSEARRCIYGHELEGYKQVRRCAVAVCTVLHCLQPAMLQIKPARSLICVTSFGVLSLMLSASVLMCRRVRMAASKCWVAARRSGKGCLRTPRWLYASQN